MAYYKNNPNAFCGSIGWHIFTFKLIPVLLPALPVQPALGLDPASAEDLVSVSDPALGPVLVTAPGLVSELGPEPDPEQPVLLVPPAPAAVSPDPSAPDPEQLLTAPAVSE